MTRRTRRCDRLVEGVAQHPWQHLWKDGSSGSSSIDGSPVRAVDGSVAHRRRHRRSPTPPPRSIAARASQLVAARGPARLPPGRALGHYVRVYCVPSGRRRPPLRPRATAIAHRRRLRRPPTPPPWSSHIQASRDPRCRSFGRKYSTVGCTPRSQKFLRRSQKCSVGCYPWARSS